MRPPAARAGAGLLCVLLGGGLAAGAFAKTEARGFQPDFEALFADHSGQVASPAPGVEVLELPGPVIVTRSSGRHVRAEDQSGHGRAGCALERLIEITAAVQICPELLSQHARDRLASLLLRAAAFAGRNTYPPLTSTEQKSALRAALATARKDEAGLCPAPDADWVRFARNLATDAAARRFDRIFSVPRLPLAQPCP